MGAAGGGIGGGVRFDCSVSSKQTWDPGDS